VIANRAHLYVLGAILLSAIYGGPKRTALQRNRERAFMRVRRLHRSDDCRCASVVTDPLALRSIADDDGDAAVRRMERVTKDAELAIGKARTLRDVSDPMACMLHKPACGIGAIRGELPVAITVRSGIGARVGVAFDGDEVWHLGELMRQQGASCGCFRRASHWW
jgi:hypothetical protein